MKKFWVAVIAAMMLAGCGGESEVSVTTDETDDSATSETPIADAVKAPIDKAAEVEALAQSRKEEMDRRLAEMEGETTEDDDEDP